MILDVEVGGLRFKTCRIRNVRIQIANKRSKVTSHQKQTNSASEKPFDSIELLKAMPRSEFSENQLARNLVLPKPETRFKKPRPMKRKNGEFSP